MSEKVGGFQDLDVWRRGMSLAETIYRLTATFPRHEQYGLSSQLQRAVISVPSNIAEGNARDSTKEYIQFVAIARGYWRRSKRNYCSPFGFATSPTRLPPRWLTSATRSAEC
jgi:hypothetical protein